MPTRAPSRDFIYVDVERVRSLYAQLHEGLIEQRQRESGAEQALKGGGEGKLPFLGSVSTEGSTLWNRKDSETWTLHDHLFNTVEARISSENLLFDFAEVFGADGDGWDRSAINSRLTPTSFVRARGHVVLYDYEGMSQLLGSIPELARNAFLFDIVTDDSLKKKATIEAEVQEQLRKNNTPSKQQIDPLSQLFQLTQSFYGDTMILKLFPFRMHSDCLLTGRLAPQSLRESISTILHKFGPRPRDQWTLFCQVAQLTERTEPAVAQTELPEGSIEGTLTAAIDRFHGILAAFSVKYPAVAVTPIALYRE